MIKRIAYILSELVAYLKRLARRREQEQAQHERDQVEDNPSDWYNDHFGGVRNDNAEDADKADPERDRNKQ